MKSLSNFSKGNINYYNNLTASIESNNMLLNEESLVMKHGKSIDSVLDKLNACQSRAYGNMLLEGQDDALFTIDEQNASRDILLVICKEWLDNVCEEYGLDIQILEDNETASGIKGYIAKIQTAAKEKAAQFKDGLKELGEKLKAVKEFIQNIMSKAIKTAKELADKFVELMLSIKESLGALIEKLGGKIEEVQKEFADRIAEVIKEKSKRPKETIYEELQNELLANQISEGWFNRKKKEEQEAPKENEYDQSASGEKNPGNEKKKGGKKLILSILKNVAISVSILIVIPALIGCAWGPAAAMIAATIAKALMSGYATWKLFKNIKDTIKSGKFKKAKPIGKLGYIILWVVSFGLIAWGATKFIKDFGTIWEAFSGGNLKQLVPDDTVQGCMKIINKIFKAFSGQDTPGYEELQKVVNGGLVEWTKTTETVETKVEPNQFSDESVAKAQEAIKTEMEGVKASDWIKELKARFDDFKGSLEKGYDYATANVKYKGGIQAVLKTSEGQEFLNQFGDSFKYIPVESSNAAGKTFSCLLAFKDGADGTEAVKAFDALLKSVGEGGAAEMIGSVSSDVATTTVVNATANALPAISGGFAAVVPIPALFKDKVNKGFLLRLGSSRSGNNIYAIKEDGIKGMKFADLKKKYGDLNSSAIKEMSATVDKNYKALLKAKEELESKEKLEKAEKKQLNAITKQIEKMKEGVDEYECIVFFSTTVVEAAKPEGEVQEGFRDLFKKKEQPEKKEIEYQPVMFVNPLCMACADLAKVRKGGEKAKPRSKPIYLKGMFASYEFLPGKEGMTEKDLNEILKNITLECVKAAWNMTADAPCIKKGRKFIANEDSPSKGKPRKDFGNFTNDEITEIFNDPSSITKYMSGANSQRSTVEKENTKFQKERKENAKKEWKKNIEENEDIKEFIKNSKSLKKNLLDKDGNVKENELDGLLDAFLRMETNYGKDQSRKSIWKRIKNMFSKDDEEATSKYDAEEIQKLAYKLASLHKKKIKESLYIDELEYLDEAIKNLSMHMDDIMSEEFLDYIMTGEIYEENVIRNFELIEE